MTDDPWEGYSLPKGYSMPPPPGVPIFVSGDDKPVYEAVRNEDGTIEIVMPEVKAYEKAYEQAVAKQIRQSTMPAFDDKVCSQTIGEHICNKPKSECGPDDPDTLHHCFYGDCDWKSMEYVQVKLGQLEVADAVLAGHARNQLGGVNCALTTAQLVAWMEQERPDLCKSVRETMRRRTAFQEEV